jgi:hypothetical protein
VNGDTAPSTASNVQPLANGSDPDNFGFNWSNTDTTFMQAVYHNTGSGYLTAKLTTPLLPLKWYHVCGTWDSFTLKAYLNGQLQASQTGSGVATAGGDFGMGNNPNRARWFVGKIDNVQMYDGAPTAAEILSTYRQQAGVSRRIVARR